MTRIVPNEECWIGFLPDIVPADLCSVPLAEITAAIDLTCLISSLTASATGNTVPTPSLCSLFETSVPGTSSATFTGEFYRDSDEDVAWDTLPRKAKGTFIIARFGVPKDATTGVPTPIVGTLIEVWPVEITSRQAGAMASGTPLTFTSNAAVNIEPCEDGAVIA